MGLFCFLGNTLCFLAIAGIYLNKGAYGYCRGTTNHYPDKEVFVSDQFLQPTCSHTGSIIPNAIKAVQIA